MTMNLPNKLTILRVIMIPFFVFFMLWPVVPYSNIIAVAIFCIASFTDFLDGYIARRDGLVSNFGKFMDPLADKLLVGAALICLIETGQLPALVVIIIISREFIISGFRLIASDNGVVIAASYWGKFKTVSQMVAVIVAFLVLNIPVVSESAAYIITNVFVWISVVLTVASGADYLVKNWKLMKLK